MTWGCEILTCSCRLHHLCGLRSVFAWKFRKISAWDHHIITTLGCQNIMARAGWYLLNQLGSYQRHQASPTQRVNARMQSIDHHITLDSRSIVAWARRSTIAQDSWRTVEWDYRDIITRGRPGKPALGARNAYCLGPLDHPGIAGEPLPRIKDN